MAIIEHSLHPADRAEMEKMRAYLAQQPKLTISPETKGIYDAFMASILPAVGVTFEQEVNRARKKPYTVSVTCRRQGPDPKGKTAGRVQTVMDTIIRNHLSHCSR